MNNRFKFRVWDSSANAYVPRSQFILLSDGTLIQEIGGEEVIWESTQPEFCTGLKDKNGKLIYEGDVVEVSEAYENGIYKVEFCQEDCEYNLYNEDGNFIYQLTKSMAKFIEIIGNIHENADLLENEE